MTDASDAKNDDAAPLDLGPDERAAVRAFLQRSEVRLSTLHRVATALLSGAGLVVLLPAIARDAVTLVLRVALRDVDLPRAALVAGIVVVLAVPLVALWLLLRELTRFYFHSHLLQATTHDTGQSAIFVPRFTLTGLRLPDGELSAQAGQALADARALPEITELLVPHKQATRKRIDQQLAAYSQQATSDQGRAEALMRLVASRDRNLLEEAAKVEAGMARHLLRLQTIVLRYVKALLIFVVTAIVIFAVAAVLGDAAETDQSIRARMTDVQAVGIALLLAVWAPVIAGVVATPVRWVEGLLRAEGAQETSVAADPELTLMERIVMTMSTLGWILALGGLTGLWTTTDVSNGLLILSVGVVAVTGCAQIWLVWRWRSRARNLR